MATLTKFEDIKAWQKVRFFCTEIVLLIEKTNLGKDYKLREQINGSSGSIMDNIAEGFERSTTTELIHFLYITKGSSGECRSMLCLCERVSKFGDFKFKISDLKGRSVSISKQLNGWIESLKNSDIKGVKFLSNKEREKIQKNKEFEEFDKEMEKRRSELLEMLKQREAESQPK